MARSADTRRPFVRAYEDFRGLAVEILKGMGVNDSLVMRF